jgi:ribosomal protein S6
MRRYETFVIIDPDLSQDIRDQVIARVEELIAQMRIDRPDGRIFGVHR